MRLLPDRPLTPFVTNVQDTGGGAGGATLSDPIGDAYTVVGAMFISPVGYEDAMRSRVQIRVGSSLNFRSTAGGDIPSKYGDVILGHDAGVVDYVVGDDSVRYVPINHAVNFRGSRLVTSGFNTEASGSKISGCVVLLDFHERTFYEATGDSHTLLIRADDVTSSTIKTAMSEPVPFPFVLRSVQFAFPCGAQNLALGGLDGLRMRLYVSDDDDTTDTWANPPENVGYDLLARRGGQGYLIAEEAVIPVPFNHPVYRRDSRIKITARNTGVSPDVNGTVIAHIERIVPTGGRYEHTTVA